MSQKIERSACLLVHLYWKRQRVTLERRGGKEYTGACTWKEKGFGDIEKRDFGFKDGWHMLKILRKEKRRTEDLKMFRSTLLI